MLKQEKCIVNNFKMINNNTHQEPIIVSKTGALPLSDYMAYLDDCGKFEDSITPLIEDFYNFLLLQPEYKKQAAAYKLACINFISYLSMYTPVRDITAITRAQICSQYKRFLNKDVYYSKRLKSRFRKRLVVYKYNDGYILKTFFMFLHLHKNITNSKVLRAFYSKEELKKIGV
jgi:hypothetical protein